MNCSGLKFVSCSYSICFFNVVNSFVSLLCLSPPLFKFCKAISLTCFNFTYPELNELLIEKNINPWNNCWTEYKSKSSEINLEFWWTGIKKSIVSNMNHNNPTHPSQNKDNSLYNSNNFNSLGHNDIFRDFRHSLRNQDICIFNTYSPVAYTYGKLTVDNLENYRVSYCDFCRVFFLFLMITKTSRFLTRFVSTREITALSLSKQDV